MIEKLRSYRSFCDFSGEVTFKQRPEEEVLEELHIHENHSSTRQRSPANYKPRKLIQWLPLSEKLPQTYRKLQG